MTISKAVLKIFLIIILFLFLIEFFSYLIITSKIGSQYLQTFNGIKKFTKNELNIYLNNRNELTGWPIKTNNSLYNQYTKEGYRITDNNFSYKKNCISLYGDSFTFGSDVSHKDAWSNLLAKKLNCSVYNFGVPAFGVDQSYLRFRENIDFNSKLTILGIYPDDIERNLTQNYSIIADNFIDIFYSKPKFIINDKNDLELIKIPINTLHDGKLFSKNFKLFLKEDELIHKYQKKLIKPTFPYVVKLIKLGHVFFQKKKNSISFTGILPDSLPFWMRKKESLKLNSKIIDLFFTTCGERNQKCKVLIIPDYTSLNYYHDTKKNINIQIYEKNIWKKNIWDPTNWLGEKMKGSNPCMYIGANNDCNGHYNENGNKLLSSFIIKKLKDENIKFNAD
mgnify:CR=1 FL=1